MLAESFMRIIYEPMVFCGMIKALVYNGGEEGNLGTDAGHRSKIRHKPFRDIASHSPQRILARR
jgi:hypothetical protein